MKKLLCIPILTFALFFSCNSEDDDDVLQNINYRQEMKDFVSVISNYAKEKSAGFIIIPQNGQELITKNGEAEGIPEMNYLNVIDGTGREDLFYGYDEDNVETSDLETAYMCAYLDICIEKNKKVLVTDYCSSHSKMDSSYILNHNKGYISFAAPERELNVIPDYPADPFNNNTIDITGLNQAENFLYLLNTENFNTKEDYLNALSATSYDILIIDCFYNDEVLTKEDVQALRQKNNGGSRLVISYMSIGEAEDYRYYWKEEWFDNFPDWIVNKNPDWPDNYIVKYWEQDWQYIIYGNESAYLDMIIESGFDGVYLDIIDAFEFFEMFY